MVEELSATEVDDDASGTAVDRSPHSVHELVSRQPIHFSHQAEMDAGPTDSDGQTEARVRWRETTGSQADCSGKLRPESCCRSCGCVSHLELWRDRGHDPRAISPMALADGP